ncbi:MAG: SPOR domain-containing protein [Deltaproteobacteria bacterium]|nr:SPOR domain-containing protein [Deltaproteobacteria bacterium]
MENPCNPELGRMTFLKFITLLFCMVIISAAIGSGSYASADEGTVFSIHLFSYKGADEAGSKVMEFNELGYNAFYRKESAEDGSEVCNLYIERFNTRPEAEKEANILKELGLISDYDVREIIEKTEDSTKKEKVEPAAEKKDLNGYYLQVSSLRQKENAEEIVKRLKDEGYNAFYNYESVKGKGDWYRVYIDEYKSKGDAEKDAKILMQSGIIAGYEVKHATEKIHAAEKAQRDETKVYSLHTASYREGGNADNDVIRLSAMGLKAFTVKADISGEQWSRVFVGEFSDEREARKAGDELLKQGIIKYFKPMIIGK